MNKTMILALGAMLFLSQTNASHAQSFSLLHTFGTNSDGNIPNGGVTLCGGTLYGTTLLGDNGSGNDSGTVYSVGTNGSNYTLLYSFTGSDGENPTTRPVVSGGLIYGTTYQGGSNYDGVIYCMCTNGSNFSLLHTFDDGPNGEAPIGDLLLVNGSLFGTTDSSGSGTNGGTLFSMCTNGSNFTVLHTFDAGVIPCFGRLALSDGTLYGMTYTGGTNDYGVIYSICTNGSNFTVLYQFTTAQGYPWGNPVISGSTLFGCTEQGSSGSGTIFSIGIDGSNFNTLHTFIDTFTNGSDGASPECALALSSNTLYGLTQAGGSDNVGTLFSISIDGSGYSVLHDFTGMTDGSDPFGTLAVSDSGAFGIAYDGGPANVGTVFALALPPTSSTPPFFTGEVALSVPGWYWLGPQGTDTYGFGYYSAAYAPYIMHQDLGWEYYLDANNANHGAYFYDFTDGVWFYTEPGVFPYLYDFNQNAWMYLAPIDGTIDRYQSGPRWFYNTSTAVWGNHL